MLRRCPRLLGRPAYSLLMLSMCRKENEPIRDYLGNKMKQGVEWYIDEILHGGETPENTTPVVINDSLQEIEIIGKAHGEHPAERKYLEERWEALVSEVERTRLAYFDNLFGTSTYFQEAEPFQHRIGVDYIMEFQRFKYKGKTSRVPMKHLRLGRTLNKKHNYFLRGTPQDLAESYLEQYNKNRLFVSHTKVYDFRGRSHDDPYSYVNPNIRETRDRFMLTWYMELETNWFHRNVISPWSTASDLMTKFVEHDLNSVFFAYLPRFSKNRVFLYSRVHQAVLSFTNEVFAANQEVIKQFLRLGAMSNIDSFPDADKLAELQRKVDSMAGVKQVFSLQDLGEYFLNFKDSFTFGVCRFIKDNGLIEEDLVSIYVDPDSQFIAANLKLNDHCLTVIVDSTSGKMYHRYLVSSEYPQYKFIRLENQQANGGNGGKASAVTALLYLRGHKDTLILDTIPLKAEHFITPVAKQDKVVSLIKYMKAFQDVLLENDVRPSDWTQLSDRTVAGLDPIAAAELVETGSGLHMLVRVLHESQKVSTLKLASDTARFVQINPPLTDAKTLTFDATSRFEFAVSMPLYGGNGASETAVRLFFREVEEIGAKQSALEAGPNSVWVELNFKEWLKSRQVKEVAFMRAGLALVISEPADISDEELLLQIHSNKPDVPGNLTISGGLVEVTFEPSELTRASPSQQQTSDFRRLLSIRGSSELPGRRFTVISSHLSKPRSQWIVELENLRAHESIDETVPDHPVQDYIEEPFVQTKHLTSRFIFSQKNTNASSSVLVWISEAKDFDVFNPMIKQLLEKDLVVLLVRLTRPASETNIKELCDEFFTISTRLKGSGLGKHRLLFGEGCLAGLAGLNSHLRDLGIYQSTAFLDPITDLLKLHKDFPEYDFGYGDMKEAENNDRMIDDSPYQTCDWDCLKDMLILVSNLERGHMALKFFSRAKHSIQPDSGVHFAVTSSDIREQFVYWFSHHFRYLSEQYQKEKAPFETQREEGFYSTVNSVMGQKVSKLLKEEKEFTYPNPYSTKHDEPSKSHNKN